MNLAAPRGSPENLRRVVASLVTIGASVFPAVASAQPTCGPGQVVVDAVGHCCSPGQAWDAATGQCSDSVAPAAPTTAPIPASPPGPPPPAGPPGVPPVTNVIVTHASLGDPTAAVPVTFAPEQPGDDESLVVQPVGVPPLTCNVPCTLTLPPGYTTITGSGQRSFTTALNIPPLAPLTVQVNHLKSSAPDFIVGGVLLAAFAGFTVGSIAEFSAGAGSCGGTPMTPTETNDQGSCSSAHTIDFVIGGLLIPGALTTLFTGIGLVLHGANAGAHPIVIMNPGDISRRPLTGSASSIRFAGIEPDFVPGGALLRTGVTF